MTTITFIEADGTRHTVQAVDGHTLMETATTHLIPGVLAECGGACACATCHVYVGPEWMGKLKPRSELEAGMLDGAIAPNDQSRLACQIEVEDRLDGLVVRLPERQI